MGRTKILFVIPTLDLSGSEKQMTLIAANLPKDRFDISVCALTRGGPYCHLLRQAGVEVNVIGKRAKWDPFAFWRLLQLIKKKQPTIVHTWLFAGNCYGRLAAKLAKVPHIIGSERCVDKWKHEYQFALDRRFAKWSDVVVTNSDAVRNFYENAGIESAKLRVIPNAFVEAEPPAKNKIEKLQELGIQDDKPVIASIGRLWPQKRIKDIIWATDILRMNGCELRLLIVGDGPRRGALERFSNNLELNGIVHFLGQRSDVRELLEVIDLLVVASEFEGMPNAALEAMAAGKPVVATRIEGMDEVVVDGVTGILVAPQQPFELAKGIRNLLGDPEKCERLGQAGRKRVSEQFTLDRMIDAYQNLYNEITHR